MKPTAPSGRPASEPGTSTSYHFSSFERARSTVPWGATASTRLGFLVQIVARSFTTRTALDGADPAATVSCPVAGAATAARTTQTERVRVMRMGTVVTATSAGPARAASGVD